MGLFKCKLCGHVYSTELLSLKSNLCRSCFIRLEDIYANSGIHNFIRDKGLSEKDFDPDELAHELKMNPRSVRLLLDMGFMDRDIQVYNQNDRQRRRELAEKISNEINKIGRRTAPIQKINSETETISYGGRVYQRKKR